MEKRVEKRVEKRMEEGMKRRSEVILEELRKLPTSPLRREVKRVLTGEEVSIEDLLQSIRAGKHNADRSERLAGPHSGVRGTTRISILLGRAEVHVFRRTAEYADLISRSTVEQS